MAGDQRSDPISRIVRSVRALIGPDRTAQSSDLAAEVETFRKEAACRQIIGIAAARYFIKQERTPDVSVAFAAVKVDSDPAWIPEILARAALTEPEFEIFGFFRNPDETILDIGAAYGYGAASIWASGATTSILSFEPNPWHLACLERSRELRPRPLLEFRFGRSSARAAMSQRFVMPVVEGAGVGGLASARSISEMDWTIPENVLRYMLDQLPDVARPRLQFTEAEWAVARLDDVLDGATFRFPIHQVAAIKIDVEVRGADVIARCRNPPSAATSRCCSSRAQTTGSPWS